VLALFASPASATYPGANGRIAYEASFKAGLPSYIHTIRPDGTGERGLGVGFDPSWSANGRRIAFARWVGRRSDIFVMDADGTHRERVTATPYQTETAPYFAPGGQRLVFDRVRTQGESVGPSVIGSIRLDGMHYERLATHAFAPEFSPDGRHIVYTKDGIWVMRRDGSHKRRLTDDQYDLHPDYRPGGRRIVLAHHGVASYINLDGSPASGPCNGEIYSPDGTRVAWSQLFGGHFGQPREYKGSDIWTTWASPGPCDRGRRVTHYERDLGYGFAYDPSWQPLPNG
jgi:hypothetical protein